MKFYYIVIVLFIFGCVHLPNKYDKKEISIEDAIQYENRALKNIHNYYSYKACIELCNNEFKDNSELRHKEFIAWEQLNKAILKKSQNVLEKIAQADIQKKQKLDKLVSFILNRWQDKYSNAPLDKRYSLCESKKARESLFVLQDF